MSDFKTPANIPLLSIIIPLFRHGKYIDRALKSVDIQTFKNYEVIIMDGGSDYGTIDIIKQFSHLPIIIYQEADQGVYDAMNKAVMRASGEWVYFMGSDDALYDNKVLECVASRCANDDSDILYGDVIFTSNGSRYAGEFSLHRLLFSNNICHQAIFYKKAIFDKIGFYNLKYKIWADWDFNIRCFRHTEFIICYMNIVIALYNDESGVSSKNDAVFAKELPLFYVFEIEYLQSQNAQLTQSKSFVIGNRIVTALNKLGASRFFK